jgi:hypothetical protein
MQCKEYSRRTKVQWYVRPFGHIRKSLELSLKLRKLGEQLKKQHEQINLAEFGNELIFEFGEDIQVDGSKAMIEKTDMRFNEISHSLKFIVQNKEVKLEGFGDNNIKFDWRFDCAIPKRDKEGNIQRNEYGEELVESWYKSKNPKDIDVFMEPTRRFTKLSLVFGTTEEKLNLSQFIQNRRIQLTTTKQDVHFIIYNMTGSKTDKSFMLNANDEAVMSYEHTENVAAHVERARIQEIKVYKEQEEKEKRSREEKRRRSNEFFYDGMALF